MKSRISRITPSLSAQAAQKKLYRPDRLSVEGAKLLMAGLLIDKFQNQVQKIETHGQDFAWVENGVPEFDKVDLRLIVKGKDKLNLIFDSVKGGVCGKTVALKQVTETDRRGKNVRSGTAAARRQPPVHFYWGI